MKAMIDKEGCIGCGMCASICPEVFRMGDDGKAEVIAEDIPDSAIAAAKEAEAGCPVSVIGISQFD